MTNFDFTVTLEQLALDLDCSADYGLDMSVRNIKVFIDGTNYALDQSGLDSLAMLTAKGQWVSVQTIIEAEADFAAERHAEDNEEYQAEARHWASIDNSMEGVR